MAFHAVADRNNPSVLDPSYHPIQDTVEIAGGTLVRLDSDGTLIKCATDKDVLGVLDYKGTATGDGETLYAVIGKPGVKFEIERPNLTPIALVPGKKVDIASGARAVTTLSNGDMIVTDSGEEYGGLAREGFIWVVPETWQLTA